MTKADKYKRDLKKIGVVTTIHPKRDISTQHLGVVHAFQVDMVFVDIENKKEPISYNSSAIDIKTRHKAVEKCLKWLWAQIPGKRRPELPIDLRHV